MLNMVQQITEQILDLRMVLYSAVIKKYGGSGHRAPYINLSRENIKSYMNQYSLSSGTDDNNVTNANFCRRFDSSYIISVSHKDRIMHTCIIHSALLALCYSDVFQPSKGHPQGVRLVHFHSMINKNVPDVKFWESKHIYKKLQ
jgi:hypothetical protein